MPQGANPISFGEMELHNLILNIFSQRIIRQNMVRGFKRLCQSALLGTQKHQLFKALHLQIAQPAILPYKPFVQAAGQDITSIQSKGLFELLALRSRQQVIGNRRNCLVRVRQQSVAAGSANAERSKLVRTVSTLIQ